jgi:hypothetical protein
MGVAEGFIVVMPILSVGAVLGAGLRCATSERQLRETVERFDLDLARDGHEVRLRGHHGGRDTDLVMVQHHIRLRVRSDRGPHRGVRLAPQIGMNGPGSTELQIGHRDFDVKYYLEGSDDEVAAMLSASARERKPTWATWPSCSRKTTRASSPSPTTRATWPSRTTTDPLCAGRDVDALIAWGGPETTAAPPRPSSGRSRPWCRWWR